MQIEPGTSPKHRYELIKATLLVIVGALIAITIVYGIPYFSPKEVADPIEPVVSVPEVKTTPVVENTPAPTPEAPKEKVYTQDELNTIFEMDKKSKDTKLFYSDKLGVGFTYLASPNENLLVKEEGNKVYLYLEKYSYKNGESLEVFDKNPNDTLTQAITKQFLNKPNTKKCFVEEESNIYKDWNLRDGYAGPFTPPNQYTAVYIFTKYDDEKECNIAPYYRLSDGIGNANAGFLLDKTNSSKYVAIQNPPVDEGGATSGYKDKSLQLLSWTDTIRFLK